MLIASCHCGSVRIEVPGPPAYLNECQCSVCRRYGVQWGYYPVDDVHVSPVQGATEIYSYGEKNLEFHRCRTCGCVTHWNDVDTTEDRTAINGRLFEPPAVTDVPIKRSPGPPS